MTISYSLELALVNSNRWKPGVAPLALDYLGAALERAGISFETLDLCPSCDPRRDIREFFSRRKPRMVGVTFRNLDDVRFGTLFLDDLKRTVEAIREAAPDAAIVLGGSGFSIAPEEVLRFCEVDLGVWGEGEVALPLLCRRLGDVSQYALIPGLVFRSDGGFVRNPQGAMPLDDFALGGTCSIDLKLYCPDSTDLGSIGVQTKRGCDRRCAYCVVPNVEGTCVRFRPPTIVADEIERLVRQGATRFFIADSEFNEPEDHAKAICEEIVRRGLNEKMWWRAYTSPVEFSPELASLMKRAGCRLAICSLDSACDEILERLNKRHRQADIARAIAAARQADLPAVYCLMIGGPGETAKTIERTTDFLMRNKPIQLTLTDPPGIRIYPETPMADLVFHEGFDRKNPNLWGPVVGNESLLKPVYYLSSELGVFRFPIKVWRWWGLTYNKIFPKMRRGMFRNRWPPKPN